MALVDVEPEWTLTDTDPADTEPTDTELTDTELTALALAADPDAPIAEGAVPIGDPPGPAGIRSPALVHATGGAPGRAPLEGALRHRRGLGLPPDRPHGSVQYLWAPDLGLRRSGA